jgi:hypothetical protein
MLQPNDHAAWWRNSVTLWEIWFAAPQVINHRLHRMHRAGATPTARDLREFSLMGQEKAEAFFESWWAMALRLWQMQIGSSASLLQQGLRPWLATAAAGMKPVHRRVTANAKRLGRRRR